MTILESSIWADTKWMETTYVMFGNNCECMWSIPSILWFSRCTRHVGLTREGSDGYTGSELESDLIWSEWRQVMPKDYFEWDL